MNRPRWRLIEWYLQKKRKEKEEEGKKVSQRNYDRIVHTYKYKHEEHLVFFYSSHSKVPAASFRYCHAFLFSAISFYLSMRLRCRVVWSDWKKKRKEWNGLYFVTLSSTLLFILFLGPGHSTRIIIIIQAIVYFYTLSFFISFYFRFIFFFCRGKKAFHVRDENVWNMWAMSS